MQRKLWLSLSSLLLALAGSMAAPTASAQDYPTKLIRFINPWPAGGPADGIIRTVADKLSIALGQPVIVESKSGANGSIGTAYVAKAPPDGYTLLMSQAGPMTVLPDMKGFTAYDPIKDFVPVSQLTANAMILVVRNELPVHNVKELIEYGKSSPKKLNLGSVGPGSTTHLAAELMRTMTGMEYVHVAYRGSTPLVTDMLRGDIDYTFVAVSAVSSYVQAGKLRALAVTSPGHYPLTPNLPTVGETLPGFQMNPWYAVHAPAGTPKAIVDRLSKEINKILQTPEVIEEFKLLQAVAQGSTPERLDALTRQDLARWAPLVHGMTFE